MNRNEIPPMFQRVPIRSQAIMIANTSFVKTNDKQLFLIGYDYVIAEMEKREKENAEKRPEVIEMEIKRLESLI